MPVDFFAQPILNSPYVRPGRHWALDAAGQPTGQVLEHRRAAEFVSPIPRSKKQGKGAAQGRLELEDDASLSTAEQRYGLAVINELRGRVEAWRQLPNPAHWQVTPETVRLLQHWRSHPFSGIRPFFCQVEAVETVIWLMEVAPQSPAMGKTFLDHLALSNWEAKPEVSRLAVKRKLGLGQVVDLSATLFFLRGSGYAEGFSF